MSFTRYRSPDEDSARWLAYEFRAGEHRHQHPVEERHDVDADDLRVARVPDRGASGAAEPVPDAL